MYAGAGSFLWSASTGGENERSRAGEICVPKNHLEGRIPPANECQCICRRAPFVQVGDQP